MNKTEFWVIHVTVQTLSWEGKFTAQPKLRDVLAALTEENLRERYATLIELVEYTINVTTGHSAAFALPKAVKIAGCIIGTFASRIDRAYNNDLELSEAC